MSKISADHLARGAYVYVRQSTADQLRNNHESRRRQYALADRARAARLDRGRRHRRRSRRLRRRCARARASSGCSRPSAAGRSARSCRSKPRAWRATAATGTRCWSSARLVGSVIVDEDGVYDPRSINDRLLLGMKGTMSEMELSLLRQRSVEALKLKAARGDLHTTVAIGFVRSEDDRIELDPDLRIREAIAAVFARFAQAGSVRQVLLWFRQERIELPAAVYDEGRRSVVWRLPSYNTVLQILSNPVYAGAYAFGRTETRVRIEAGRKRVVRGHRREREHWQVLIVEHHDGYIDWATYEHNQRVIADNTNMRGGMARGALRRGEALLAGLLRCAHCGRKLHVAYSGSDGNISRYHCRGAAINHGSPHKCISFGSLRVDQRRRRRGPAACCGPIGVRGRAARDRAARRRRPGQAPAARTRARAGALRGRTRAAPVRRRRPGNRLVAGELERRWNERLAQVVAATGRDRGSWTPSQARRMTPQQREALLALGADLPRVWDHPAAGNETRKRILRAVIKEIVARVADARIELVIHWQGGDHTELSVVKNRTGQHRWTTDVEVQTLITQLARQLNDGSIASLLNRLGHRTGRELTWTETRVRSFRCSHGIAVYKDGEREQRGEVTLEQAAELLGDEQDDGAAHDQRRHARAPRRPARARPGSSSAATCSEPEVRAARLSRRRLVRAPADPKQISLELQ